MYLLLHVRCCLLLYVAGILLLLHPELVVMELLQVLRGRGQVCRGLPCRDIYPLALRGDWLLKRGGGRGRDCGFFFLFKLGALLLILIFREPPDRLPLGER